MPQVTTRYRVILTAGHHRQPRNGSSWVEPYPPGQVNAQPGSLAHSFAPPALSFTQGGQTGSADFLFWSAGDGASGQTSTDPSFSVEVANSPLSVVAWYLPPGGVGNGSPGFVVDAFSDALNDFVDDDFVQVAPDAALTSDANVVGWVPTGNAETLDAVPGSIHTGEVFERWIGGAPVPQTHTDQLGQAASGYAVAAYHAQNLQVPKPSQYDFLTTWLILFGIINDGGGLQIHLGGGGGGPVGPWGPYLARVGKAALIASAAASMAGADAITKVALTEIAAATKELQAGLRR